MKLQVNIPEPLAEKVYRAAESQGKTPEDVALQAIEKQFGEEATLSPQEWVEDIRAWAAAHPILTHEIDDSRETIYAGRGE